MPLRSASLPETLAVILNDENTEVLIVTGAGLSKASGVPLYRSESGQADPFYERCGRRQAFLADPEAAWGHWRHIHDTPAWRNAQPNVGHFALSVLAEHGNGRIKIITQNVDGLLVQAGCPSDHVIEIHGRLGAFRCSNTTCHRSTRDPIVDTQHRSCPDCGTEALLPLVLLFDESLGFHQEDECHKAFQAHKAQEWMRWADVLLLVGTSCSTQATDRALELASKRHVPIWIINPASVQPLEYNTYGPPGCRPSTEEVDGRCVRHIRERVEDIAMRLLPNDDLRAHVNARMAA
ncbi:unnamed protein product [Vitrella brassicaformis CCMP3155]|uniref:Deacetylase sirtuin-type domain-containing protein n=1 Tax=Vitrella brassicaformis (strain CCMP3155) TaxID=1169540 RepID=A0A0G4H6Y8_VITBC|nr:unnamed protein product [Vitrella brassicaformis CCMP3155]|mmetsp:Transcript_1972/g.4327  ORF Transcript_1972/g.4327 Transcript_1972/m.4327 type:complete len:293 (-) Transcript_1972:374-1252(-)|eukprot:CEM39589.1 unnamed protein product [Vitrella brassicaformis CCMP3155]